jgi:hypothetical protein
MGVRDETITLPLAECCYPDSRVDLSSGVVRSDPRRTKSVKDTERTRRAVNQTMRVIGFDGDFDAAHPTIDTRRDFRITSARILFNHAAAARVADGRGCRLLSAATVVEQTARNLTLILRSTASAPRLAAVFDRPRHCSWRGRRRGCSPVKVSDKDWRSRDVMSEHAPEEARCPS